MPRQELWSTLHVRGLMDLVHLEPVADAPGRCIRFHPGEEPVVQFDDRVLEQRSFRCIDIKNASANSIS